MALYLYGSSALEATRYLRSTNDGSVPSMPAFPQKLGGSVHTHRQLNELNHSAELVLSHVKTPIHVLVPNRNLAARTSRLMPHVWSHPISTGAYRNLGNGIYLPTPAFLIQQLAIDLDEIDLVCVGMELCGFYSRWALPGAAWVPTGFEERRDCTFEIAPLTSVAKMTQYLSGRKGERGYARALRAATRMLDHSASPMETATYLLLCLPRRLGGQGLPAPVLNAKVCVTASTTTTTRYPDLYWPEQSLDVEYQSDQDHSGEWSRYRDSKRMVELAAEKIVVLPLSRSQLMNATEFDSFATSVRRNLGIRTRPRTTDWWYKYLDLRTALLRRHDAP